MSRLPVTPRTIASMLMPPPWRFFHLLGAPAARLVQRHRTSLFPATPMLLATVEERRVEPSMLSANDVVAPVRVDHVAAFENILRVLPDTKTIALVVGNSPPERSWIDSVRRELEPALRKRVAIRFYNELPFDAMLARLAALPPDSAIFFQQLFVDGAGAVYGDKAPLSRIVAVANAPVFTFDDVYFDQGIVGGPMFSAVIAEPTAAAAIRMLRGARAADIHVPTGTFAKPKYDWRELQRWKIDERRLPPGAEVEHRPPSAWERYSREITAIVVVIIVLALLVTVLLHERQLRQRAEAQSRRRLLELAHLDRVSTAGELATLVTHELSQPLASIRFNAKAAEMMLRSPEPDLRELGAIVGDIHGAEERAGDVIRRMRSLLKKTPYEASRLDLNQLVAETVDFLSMLARRDNTELASAYSAQPVTVHGDPVQLQQVVTNLIVNAIEAMKHLPHDSRIVRIAVSRSDAIAEVSVADNGPGIPADQVESIFTPFFTTKHDGMGIGLSITRTIVEAHGGEISATSSDSGASFRMTLPLAR